MHVFSSRTSEHQTELSSVLFLIFYDQVSIAYHGPYLQLIEKLLPVMPDPSLDSFFFWNSGSEAVEAAVKIARLVTGKQNVIAMQGKQILVIC